jgi:two-component system, cell cycle response regulator DivK
MTHALIIEDNRMNIDVLVMLLNKERVTFTAVESPRHAVDILSAVSPVDIIFLDLEFPNDDGFSAIGMLQSQPELEGVPVVAYTVHTSEIDTVRRAGFHSFLGKPLSTQRFPDQLRRILGGVRVWEG